jgi:hypothetical protein
MNPILVAPTLVAGTEEEEEEAGGGSGAEAPPKPILEIIPDINPPLEEARDPVGDDGVDGAIVEIGFKLACVIGVDKDPGGFTC